MAAKSWWTPSAAVLIYGSVSSENPPWIRRQRQSVGFTPAANIAQLIFALTSGGASLADAERIGQDRVLMDLVGLKKGADQTTLGEWLRAQQQGKRAGLAPDQRGVGGLGQRAGAARPLAARQPGGSIF